MNSELIGTPAAQTLEQKQANSTAALSELKSLAAPLVEWIRKNHGYNTEVHISADFVCVKHDGMSLPFPIIEI